MEGLNHSDEPAVNKNKNHDISRFSQIYDFSIVSSLGGKEDQDENE